MTPASASAVAPGRHIAHILPWRNVGGTEIATLRLSRAAADHGHSSTIFRLPDSPEVRDLFEEEGVPTVEFEPVTPSYRSLLRYVRASRVLAGKLREHGVDAIHCADVRGAFHAGLAGRLAGLPVLCHVRNRYSDLPLRDRSFLWQVDHFVFVSRETWRHFAHRVPESRGTVLYDGIGIPPESSPALRGRLRDELGIPGDAPVAGMVARVARQKDYETLIRAATRVLDELPTARFVVVGDYESTADHRQYHQELAEQIREVGIEDRFLFAGYRTDVDDLLETFDVFVLSTHWEGFPLVILEAMAHRLPVVATAVDGIPEIVAPGENGYLFEEGDAAALATRLIELLGDPSRARRLGARARECVETEYSAEAYVRNVGALYESVLGWKGQKQTA